jgi:hypothetical protein
MMTSTVDFSIMVFYFMFNTYISTTVYQSQVTCVCLSGLSISAARERIKLEVTSPFDSLTTASCWCSIYISCFACTIRKFYSIFRSSVMAEC